MKKMLNIISVIFLLIGLFGCTSSSNATKNTNSSGNSSSNMSDNNQNTKSNSKTQEQQEIIQTPEDDIIFINKMIGSVDIHGNAASSQIDPKKEMCKVSFYGYSFKDGKFKAYVELKNDSPNSSELAGSNGVNFNGFVTTVQGQQVPFIDDNIFPNKYKKYGLPSGTSHIEIFEVNGLTSAPEKVILVAGMNSSYNLKTGGFNIQEGEQKKISSVIFPITFSPNVNISNTFNQLSQLSESLQPLTDIDSAIVEKINYTQNGGEIRLVLKSSKYSNYPTEIRPEILTELNPNTRIVTKKRLRFELITDQNEGIELISEMSANVKAKLQNEQLPANEPCILTLKFSTKLTKDASSAKIRINYGNEDCNRDYYDYVDFIKSDSEYFKLK